MTIRRATAADRALIMGLLDALPEEFHVPWPEPETPVDPPPAPYWITSPKCHVWVDDAIPALCRIDAMPERLAAGVIWLLPRAELKADNWRPLMRLLRATLADVLLGQRQAGGWTVSATFVATADNAEELCRFWQTKFPGAAVRRRPDLRFEIVWNMRDAARQVVP